MFRRGENGTKIRVSSLPQSLKEDHAEGHEATGAGRRRRDERDSEANSAAAGECGAFGAVRANDAQTAAGAATERRVRPRRLTGAQEAGTLYTPRPILRAALSVVATLLRVGVLLVVLAGLWLARSGGLTLVAQLLYLGGSAVALVVAFGRGHRAKPLIIYLVGYGLFTQLRGLADEAGLPVSFDYVVGMDRALALGVVPSAWLQERFYATGQPTLLDVATSAIYVSYFFVGHAVVIGAWIRQRERFGLYAGAILLTYYLGLLCSLLLPTAPPWLASEQGDIPPVARIFRDLLSGLQAGSYDQGAQAAGLNEVAAMPSLHTAVTALIAMFALHLSRRLGAVAVLYTLAMGFALVYLGEHYVADVVAGVVIAALSWSIALRFWARQPFEDRLPEALPGAIECQVA